MRPFKKKHSNSPRTTPSSKSNRIPDRNISNTEITSSEVTTLDKGAQSPCDPWPLPSEAKITATAVTSPNRKSSHSENFSQIGTTTNDIDDVRNTVVNLSDERFMVEVETVAIRSSATSIRESYLGDVVHGVRETSAETNQQNHSEPDKNQLKQPKIVIIDV